MGFMLFALHLQQTQQSLNLGFAQKVNSHLSIPKRKYKNVSVHESEVKLKGYSNTFRQITLKDHGRNKPTFIITNNKVSSLCTGLKTVWDKLIAPTIFRKFIDMPERVVYDGNIGGREGKFWLFIIDCLDFIFINAKLALSIAWELDILKACVLKA